MAFLATPKVLEKLITAQNPPSVSKFGTPVRGQTYVGPNGVAGLIGRPEPVAPQQPGTGTATLGAPREAYADDYDKRIHDLEQQQTLDLQVFDQQNMAALTQLGQDVAALKQQLANAQQLAATGAREWGQDAPNPDAIAQQLAAKEAEIAQRTQARQALLDKQKSTVVLARNTADALRSHAARQNAIDNTNRTLAEKYNSQVDPYNAGVDAYGRYLNDQATWQKDADQQQADIDAGKYRVDPFSYLHGQHSLPEIEELRKQINAGNMRPNMGVPALRAAPTVVQRPGEAPTRPDLQADDPDVQMSSEIANILGYKAPTKNSVTLKEAKPVAEAPQPVVTQPKPANPEAPAKPLVNPNTVNQAGGNPPPPSKPATQQTTQSSPLTTQQTSAQSQTAPAPAQPVNVSTSLPQQTAGSVAGQAPAASSNNSEGTKPQATPDALANPAPFKDPDKTDDKDKKWEL